MIGAIFQVGDQAKAIDEAEGMSGGTQMFSMPNSTVDKERRSGTRLTLGGVMFQIAVLAIVLSIVARGPSAQAVIGTGSCSA